MAGANARTMSLSPFPSIALIIESRDPRANEPARMEHVARLLEHARPLAQTGRLAEVAIVHHGTPEAERGALAALAGVPVCFVQVSAGTGYHAAKHLGFEATGSDVVVFADADGMPEDGWLERLCAPFAQEGVEAVQGRIAYPADPLGAVRTAVELLQGGGFQLDNVAFRREVFEAFRYAPGDALYGGSARAIARRLAAAGVTVRQEPQARLVRPSPSSLRELAQLRRWRGLDEPGVAKVLKFALRWMLTLDRRLAPELGLVYRVIRLRLHSALERTGLRAGVPALGEGILLSYHPADRGLGSSDFRAA